MSELAGRSGFRVALAWGGAVILGLFAGPPVAQAADEKSLARSPDDARLAWEDCPAPFSEACQIARLKAPGSTTHEDQDVLVRFRKGYKSAAYRFPSARRMLVLSGEVEMVHEGEPPETLGPGGYFYTPPDAEVHFTCSEAGPCVVYRHFEERHDILFREEPKR